MCLYALQERRLESLQNAHMMQILAAILDFTVGAQFTGISIIKYYQSVWASEFVLKVHRGKLVMSGKMRRNVGYFHRKFMVEQGILQSEGIFLK